MSRRILILGATSVLAQKISKAVCRTDDQVVLAARDTSELKFVASDLVARAGCSTTELGFDAVRFDTHPEFAAVVLATLGAPDIVIVATGALGDQVAARDDPQRVLEIIASNFVGVATALGPVIGEMEQRGSGHIIVLSSVAGDRGRASNYIYGAGKAGMNAWLSGLRNRLHSSGVRVTTMKLGFVDTRMIFGKPGTFSIADPGDIARRVAELTEMPRDIVYAPGFWFLIMTFIRIIPETIFKRLKL